MHLVRSWRLIFFGILSIPSDSNSSGIKPGPIQTLLEVTEVGTCGKVAECRFIV